MSLFQYAEEVIHLWQSSIGVGIVDTSSEN